MKLPRFIKIMGNIISHSKHSKHDHPIKVIPEFEQQTKEELVYYLPRDVSDLDRQHSLHFFKRHLFNGNFSSPIEDELIRGCKVLDVGCGPGTWLLDLSNTYENSKFFGLDFKSFFPQAIKPNNLEFIEADIFAGLPFPDNELDFVHMETMGFILTNDQWDFALSELIRVTKPGGYIELAELSINYKNDGPIIHKVTEGFISFCSKQNVDANLVLKLDSKFESQPNITKVHRDERRFITGPNGDKIGLVSQELFTSFFITDMATEILSNELGISEELYKNMIEKDLIEELEQTSPEGFNVRFYAQKK